MGVKRRGTQIQIQTARENIPAYGGSVEVQENPLLGSDRLCFVGVAERSSNADCMTDRPD